MKAIRDHVNQGKWQEVVEACNEFTEDPDRKCTFQLYSWLGKALQELGKLTASLEAYNNAAQIDPALVTKEPKFWITLTDLAQTAGMYEVFIHI